MSILLCGICHLRGFRVPGTCGPDRMYCAKCWYGEFGAPPVDTDLTLTNEQHAAMCAFVADVAPAPPGTKFN
jgi:hypothetical protein